MGAEGFSQGRLYYRGRDVGFDEHLTKEGGRVKGGGGGAVGGVVRGCVGALLGKLCCQVGLTASLRQGKYGGQPSLHPSAPPLPSKAIGRSMWRLTLSELQRYPFIISTPGPPLSASLSSTATAQR